MGLSMADGIAALARVDVAAVGLADFGKPEGWLERQVDRWRSHLRSYDAMEGYPGPEGIPDVERVATWLESRRPRTWTAGLIHGDFHFANVLVHPEEGRLAAIVDWELATIGDPLLDLGHLLAMWPAPAAPTPLTGAAAGALPSRDELIARYADGSGRPVDDVDWYQVLACYRLGIILEGTHARAAAGLAPEAVGAMLHAHTVSLFAQAHRLIDAAS
jgi:aminoglycoside phosphotransferase (APT) family kinase protein